MPKIIKIKCANCGKIIGDKRDDKFYILSRNKGQDAYTVINMKHNNGGYVEFTCSECNKDNYFRRTEVTKDLTYCVAKKEPVDK